jgi:peptide/nickel transport system substrate-binding protein
LKKPLLSPLLRDRSVPALDRIQKTFESLSLTEKLAFGAAAVVFAWGALSLLTKVSLHFTVGVPERGGELVEGVIGTPRFVNPLLAVSDADRDLSVLVYSGLLKATPEGDFIPDLAESFSISPDSLTYTVKLRSNAVFHDGAPVTADDVVFTVLRAQDPALKSPRRVNWDGVTVKKIGEREVSFTLKQPYAPFLSNLSLGILPERLWKNVGPEAFAFSDLNINPVGSGPFIMVTVKKDGSGVPSEFDLKSNPSYALGEPYIQSMVFKFYTSESALVAALRAGDIESASNLSPSAAAGLGSDYRLLTAPLTRVFGIFFNQNENEVLAHKEVRKALDAAIDRDALIGSVLVGFGSQADGPLPPSLSATGESTKDAATAHATSTAISRARDILSKAGWKKNGNDVFELKPKAKGAASSTLSLSLSTANVPELVMAAKSIEQSWTEAGAKVDVRVYEPADLNQGIIRPRKYDALLFGIVTGKNSDLYPFWHSSQRNDPGLNIALYTNAKADKLLESMRKATSTADVAALYDKFKTEIDADTPAIFLWSPDFIYALPDDLRGVRLGEVTTPSDRFLSVSDWYIETDHVWRVFAGDRKTVTDESTD